MNNFSLTKILYLINSRRNFSNGSSSLNEFLNIFLNIFFEMCAMYLSTRDGNARFLDSHLESEKMIR